MRAATRLKVTAHLIDAATEEHVWSESYEREPRDILFLQNEIVRAIAQKAKLNLTPAERTRLDAFPSGHTAIALVSAAVGARHAPRYGPALLAWAAAVVFSTVYIHVHYVVDVVAGAALAAAIVAGAPTLERVLERRRRRGPAW